jgi:exodeoxyribonuclease V gamma subunit
LEHPLEPLDNRSADIELIRKLLTDPAKEFLRQRLNVVFAPDVQLSPTEIPIELDSLQRWKLKDELLGELAAGDRGVSESLERFRENWSLSGLLPPGRLGEIELEKVADPVKDLFAAAHVELIAALGNSALLNEAEHKEIDIELPNGFTVTGEVPGIYEPSEDLGICIIVEAGTLNPKRRLKGWIYQVGVAAAYPKQQWQTILVTQGNTQKEPVIVNRLQCTHSQALEALTGLSRLYEQGLREPLPYLLDVTWQRADEPEKASRASDLYAWESAERKGDLPVQGKPENLTLYGPDSQPPWFGRETELSAITKQIWDQYLQAGGQ